MIKNTAMFLYLVKRICKMLPHGIISASWRSYDRTNLRKHHVTY